MSKNSNKFRKYNRAKIKEDANNDVDPSYEDIYDDYRDDYDNSPSLYEIIIGKWLCTMSKLKIKAAKILLEDWYW